MLRILAPMMLTFICFPAAAQSRTVYVDGNELHAICGDLGQQHYCFGFVAGVADALEATRWPTPRTCRPKQVELTQIVDMAWKQLVDNPADRHRPAFDLVADILVETWPCP
jgi:hypothetical protein